MTQDTIENDREDSTEAEELRVCFSGCKMIVRKFFIVTTNIFIEA
jgi:hypothetical protein